MLDLILTRHGYPASGSVWLGSRLDPPLSPEGRAQADALARRLAGVRIDRIISSPMLRALETARAIATDRPIEVDQRLREEDCGRWEGLTAAEIETGDPELKARWEDDPAGNHLPGGESGDDVAARTRAFLRDLLAAELAGGAKAGRRSPDPGGSRGTVTEAQAELARERRVMVVGHSALNRILMCVALGIPVRDYRRRFIQDRTNLTVLRYEDDDTPDGAQLVLANDLAHLRSPGEAEGG